MIRNWSEERTTFAEIREEIRQFLRARDWEKQHSPKNLAMSIAIEAAELMEIFQWVDSKEALEYVRSDPDRLQHAREEIADVVIYCVSMANALEIDLARAIDDKIGRNAQRYPALSTGTLQRDVNGGDE